MSEWLPTIYNWLAILGGIILTHSLFLNIQFYRKAEGYMWRATRKLWLFLLMFFGVEWLIGALFFYLTLGLPQYASVPTLLFASIIGIILAAIPTALEKLLLPGVGTTVDTVQRPLTRVLLKLNLALRHNFAWGIESCRQQDVFDCQRANAWGLNISPRELGRRIRKLYEFSKKDIAEERGDKSLLTFDVDHTPWEMFYLLARHLGRKRLRENLVNPVTWHCPEWDGAERRRRVGTSANREDPEAVKNLRHRMYDNRELIERIESGQTMPKDYLQER